MRAIIEAAWENRSLLNEERTIQAIEHVIEEIDKGRLRVAEPIADGEWQVNEWVKKAVILYFPIRKMETIEVGPFEFHDKMALKSNYEALGVRVVPPAVGWLTAGGSLYDPQFFALGLFFFVWQVPHFWLLVMLHHGDYSNAGYPTVMRLFGRFSLQRLTFTWLLMTIATGYFMAIIFDIQSIVVALLLIVTSLLAFTSSLQLLKQSFELKDARKVFVQINLAFLAAVIFVSIDQYLKFNF
jgi:hypothetical protein